MMSHPSEAPRPSAGFFCCFVVAQGCPLPTRRKESCLFKRAARAIAQVCSVRAMPMRLFARVTSAWAALNPQFLWRSDDVHARTQPQGGESIADSLLLAMSPPVMVAVPRLPASDPAFYPIFAARRTNPRAEGHPRSSVLVRPFEEETRRLAPCLRTRASLLVHCRPDGQSVD
jgi:hypothetical protein